jgi:hypothetical protein
VTKAKAKASQAMIARLSRSAVGSLNLSVFHDWHLDRLFMLLTLYADESGLGGRVAKLGKWIEFDHHWRRLLRRNKLDYFDAKQFQDWSPPEQASFLDKADQLVGKHMLCSFAITLNPDEYKTTYRQIERPKKLQIDSKYGLCFRTMLCQVPRWVNRSLPPGNHEINFVLEEGDPGSGDAKRIFDEAKKDGPDDLKTILGTLTYGPKKKFPGLQSADLLAFGAYHTEQSERLRLIKVSDNHTVAEARKLSKVKSPVWRMHIDANVMNYLVQAGIADIEERRRFWREGLLK